MHSMGIRNTADTMDTPRSNKGTESSRKSRATSCTTCRQVKLKCDLKERYPNPCSRCSHLACECKTDASFKRVPARSRIKDLESQLDRLKRSRALSQASSPVPPTDSSPELKYCTPSFSCLDEQHQSRATSVSYDSPSGSEISRADVKWLNIMEAESPVHFTLGDFSMPYHQASQLFQHFEDFYYPYFCILEPIVSLAQLSIESNFLFWSILLVASRNHAFHALSFDRIRHNLRSLYTSLIAEEVQSFLDLQALLLLCSFDCRVIGQSRGSSWLQVGMAINAARQLGLDKDTDEVMLGSRNGQGFLDRHPRHVRQMTWMKCFELDVQSSCWHGHLPTLGYAKYARTVARFCDSLPLFGTYAAIVNVNVELAQMLLSLEAGQSSGHEPSAYLVGMYNDRFNALKSKWSSSWSVNAEIELLNSKLHVYNAVETGSRRRSEESHPEVLPASHTVAVQLATLLTDIHAESKSNIHATQFTRNVGWSLFGCPVHYPAAAAFAAATLLKYLDRPQSEVGYGTETARNAYVKTCQMFAACPASTSAEHQSTARVLEAIGRAVGNNTRQVLQHVTARTLANQLQTKETNLEVQFSGASLVLDGPNLMPPLTPCAASTYGPVEQFCTTASSVNPGFGASLWENLPVSVTDAHMPSLYGLWDNAGVDEWQATLPYPFTTELLE